MPQERKNFNLLCFDVETSGMWKQGDNPCANENGYYQIVSIGLIVTDVNTLTPKDALYLEIQWNGESIWSDEAEKIHGLSIKYLKENGVSEEDAVVEIASFLLKHFGPNGVIRTLGYNQVLFDLPFLRHLLNRYDIFPKFNYRHADLFGVGLIALNAQSSNDLFDVMGFEERNANKHNALEDAEMTLTSARNIRRIFDSFLEE